MPRLGGRRGLGGRLSGAGAAKPREGLAVVAVEGAPAGGGGALRDLQRGLASPSVDPCAGADRDLFGVSGVVPDGVDAVFVTAADGSATRADVRDNGYSFMLPRSRVAEPRYLVWTGADGTPHVQPLQALRVFAPVGPCRGNADPPVRVTPDPWSAACGPMPASIMSMPTAVVFPARPTRAVPIRPGSARRERPGRRMVVPARPLPARMRRAPLAPCSAIEAPPVALPRVLRAPSPVSPRALRQVPAPSAAPVPRPPRAAPAPAAPAAPRPAPPRAP